MKKRSFFCITSALACLPLATAFAAATRVADLNTNTDGSEPAEFVRIGTNVYFFATDGIHGYELWKLDNADTASLVKDIHPGAASSNPEELTAVGGTLYFVANDGTTGSELWKSDGTSAGTALVIDYVPNAGSSEPKDLIAYDGTLYYTAYSDAFGRELCRISNITTGAITCTDLRPGPETSGVTEMTVVSTSSGNQLLFSAYDETAGYEPWLVENNGDLPERLEDVNPGSGSSSPKDFTVLGSRVYFRAYENSGGGELYYYDPADTANPVDLLKDIDPSGGSNPTELVVFDNEIYFMAEDATHGKELWHTDGTAGGTALVEDAVPGTGHHEPAELTIAGSVLFYRGKDDSGNSGLWYKLAGAPGVEQAVPAIPINALSGLMAVGSTVYFSAHSSANGYELWKADAANPSSPALVKDINPGLASGTDYSLRSSESLADGTRLLFQASVSSNGLELWASNGTETGTTQLADINQQGAGSYPMGMTLYNNEVYFIANSSEHGYELHAYDGTTVRLVKDINPGPSSSMGFEDSNIVIAGNTLYFFAYNIASGTALWKSDGTEAGTEIVKVIDQPERLTAFGNKLVFSNRDATYGREPWVSDGTPTGTHLLADLNPGSAGSNPDEFTELNGLLYFTAYDNYTTYGQELWKTDGTPAGTGIAVDIDPGTSSSYPEELVAANGKLYFSSFSNSFTVSDGTPAGTEVIYELDPTFASGEIEEIIWLPDVQRFFISGTTDATGNEVWISDGTTAGTYMLPEHPRTEHNAFTPGGAISYQGDIYYYDFDDDHGYQLWRHTSGGATERVSNIPQPDDLSLFNWRFIVSAMVFDDKLYFGLDDLWVSDGTTQGTSLYQDINTLEGGLAAPNNFFVMPDYALFIASDGQTGYELWRLNKESDSDDGGDSGDNNDGDSTPAPRAGSGGGTFGFPLLAALLLAALRRRMS